LKGLDTNVLVRYLGQDDPSQSAQATRYIETHCTNNNPCFISQLVLCELAWVLESNYNQSRDDVASMVEIILQVSQLEVMESEAVWRALNDYQNSNVDFPDHLLARINEARGCTETMTFDKKASKQPGFQLLR